METVKSADVVSGLQQWQNDYILSNKENHENSAYEHIVSHQSITLQVAGTLLFCITAFSLCCLYKYCSCELHCFWFHLHLSLLLRAEIQCD